MRKFTLFIASLFLTVGTMAQTLFSEPQVGKLYKIKGENTTMPWLTNQVISSEQNGLRVSANENDAAIFLKTEKGFQDVSSEKYFYYQGWGEITLNTSATDVTLNNPKSTNDGTMYAINLKQAYLYNNDNDDNPTTHTGGFNANSQTRWGFIEVTLEVSEGKYYAFDSYQSWVGLKNNNITDIYSNVTTVDTKALWQFINAGDGVYNIKNAHTGLYIGSNAKMTDNENSYGKFQLTDENYEDGIKKSAVKGNLFIKFNGANIYNCLHSANPNGIVSSWTGGGLGNQYRIIEVSEFSHTLNIGATGWATLILGFPAEIPEVEGNEIGVFIATKSTVANSVHLTKIEGDVLPANTAVIVKANPNSTIEFKYSAETPVGINGNLLTGTLYDKNITENAYVLTADADDENGVCFGLAIKNQANGSAFKNNANKAYLPATVGASLSASLRFDFGGTTAIEEVETEATETVIYDLTGRRISEITEAGVYIVNGKKVLVK